MWHSLQYCYKIELNTFKALTKFISTNLSRKKWTDTRKCCLYYTESEQRLCNKYEKNNK